MILPVLGGASAVIAVFWLTVVVLNHFVPPCPQDVLAFQLTAPFRKYSADGAAYSRGAPLLTGAADTGVRPEESTYLICENRTPLGPAHSLHADIDSKGRGRFSHWALSGFVFSASDNSDPNSNGRTYTVTRSCDHAQPAGLCGSWRGVVSQHNPPATYPVAMQLYGHDGHITYSSAGCGGRLELLRTDGTGHWYQEHITYGGDKCSDGGMIEMQPRPSGGGTSWNWTWTGDGVSVTGVLRDAGVRRRRR
jgi:hypothetical protein